MAEHAGGEPFLDCPPANDEKGAVLGETDSRGRPKAQEQDEEMCEEPRSAAALSTPPPPKVTAQTCPDAPSEDQKGGQQPLGDSRNQTGALPSQGCQAEQRCAPPAGEEGQKQVGKKKHRRRPSKKKRRWKPYFMLTWEEKQQLEERETLRAARVRAEMFAKGQPVAPYNTTQFLMEDHDQEEPDLKTGLCPPRRSTTKSDDTSDEDFGDEEEGGSDGMGGGGMGDGGGEFLQRDFSETYEKYHAESLQNMSKQELIREYLELEKCLCRMEEENNRLRLEGKKPPQVPGAADSQVRELEQQLESLRAENSRLLQERELQGAACPGQLGD
ncbi:LOW QUALITY PROTEIN: protein HEXIM1 [Microcaecilia unicolor]|uniref:LOW QUALITY PROTEIN: protein HEXIM1 n=1 Tax=Microcaecilia unicolor TaxID=1415580 RepID=A0A6P7ZVM7_9AMPH|nr:LOW QUALITY PROTEIN: protein HEXIM1 [Microcaecilia unicolor]